jgi:hypothetical protein
MDARRRTSQSTTQTITVVTFDLERRPASFHRLSLSLPFIQGNRLARQLTFTAVADLFLLDAELDNFSFDFETIALI